MKPSRQPRLDLTRRQHVLAAILIASLLAVLGYSLSRGLGLDAWLKLLIPVTALGALLGMVGSRRPVPVAAGLAALAALGLGALYLTPLAAWRSALHAGFDLVLASTGQGGPPPALLLAETAAAGLILFWGSVLAGWAAGWSVWQRAWTLPLLLAGIGVLGAQWLWYVEYAHAAMVAFWLLWLPLAGLVTAGARQAAWVQGGARLSRPATELAAITATLLGLAVAFVAVSMPSRLAPVNLEAVSRAISDALPRLEGLRGATSSGGSGYRFTLARTGFARSQEHLGGPVRTDQSEALRVVITTPVPPETLYLRGSIDTQYTGRGWHTPPEIKGDGIRLANPVRLVPEIPLAASLIPPDEWVPGVSGGLPTPEGVIPQSPQQGGTPASFRLVPGPGSVTLLEIDPKSISPGKPVIIDPSSLPPDMVQIDQTLLPPGTTVLFGAAELPPGVRVQIDLRSSRSSEQPAADQPVTPRAHLARLPGTHATITITTSGLRSNSIFVPTGVTDLMIPEGTVRRDLVGDLTTDKVLPKNQSYTEQAELIVAPGDVLQRIAAGKNPDLAPYLSLPAELPARVGDLTRQITAGETSDYEKALALESYLRGLRYTLDAPAPPADRDFVDYFLFDLKEGYCAYSSTAMAVMLRTIGIPSRWVQGFAVPLDQGMGTYSVPNSEAHAWVEAYFQGYGWVLFDPTPRLSTPDRTLLPPKPGESGPTGGTGDGGTGGGVTPGHRPSLDDPEAGDTLDNALPAAQQTPFPWGRVLRGTLLTLIGLLLASLILLSSTLWWRERIPPGTRAVQLRAAFRNMERLLARFDRGRQAGQTPAEWLESLRRHWPDLAGDLQATLAAYQAARYGQQAPEPEALERAMALWRAVRQRLRQEAGFTAYLWGRLRPDPLRPSPLRPERLESRGM